MEPIETEYKGYRFRSRLEARWAVIFEWMRVDWKYEPEGFTLPNEGRYLPDFYLPDFEAILQQTTPARKSGIWIEVKGGEATQNERAKARELARESGLPTLIVCGVGESDVVWFYPHHGGQPMKNNLIDVLSYMMYHNFKDGLYGCCLDAEIALEKARSARFEHGEKGVAG